MSTRNHSPCALLGTLVNWLWGTEGGCELGTKASSFSPRAVRHSEGLYLYHRVVGTASQVYRWSDRCREVCSDPLGAGSRSGLLCFQGCPQLPPLPATLCSVFFHLTPPRAPRYQAERRQLRLRGGCPSGGPDSGPRVPGNPQSHRRGAVLLWLALRL